MRRVLIAGGAGHIGSHLCEAHLARGDAVVCVDDFSTGDRANIAHLEGQLLVWTRSEGLTGVVAL